MNTRKPINTVLEMCLWRSYGAKAKDASNAVYATQEYNGRLDTPNSDDGAFSDSLTGNMTDAVIGNITDGYTLTKTIKVAS